MPDQPEVTTLPLPDPAPGHCSAELTAPGLQATASHAPQLAAAAPSAPQIDADLRLALGNAGLTDLHTSLLRPTTTPLGHATLSVQPNPGHRAVLLVQDENGVISWHRPHRPGAPTTRTDHPAPAGTTAHFRIPAHRLSATPTTPPVGPAAGAALTADLPVKLLSVLEFPADLAGRDAAELYAAWERRARPPVVRWFLPKGGLTQGAPMTDATWRELAQGRTLLFIHGIFSSCESGFSHLLDPEALDHDALWAALHATYQDRIIGYDHPTSSVTPQDNAAAFLEMIPPDVTLELDVVCHSRGGLVARLLANAHHPVAESWPRALWRSVSGLFGGLPERPGGHVTTEKIVFVGTPNGGTAIVEKSHWDALIDGFTNLLRLDPPGPWTVTNVALAGLLELLKVIAEQGEAKLPGLAAMEPDSTLYAELDASTQGTRTHYAIAADYEPSNALRQLFNLGHDLGELTDSSIDTIFDQHPNDVAVPAQGVGDPAAVQPDHPAIPGFPIPPARRYDFPAGEVWHCSYFKQPETRRHLCLWLTGVELAAEQPGP